VVQVTFYIVLSVWDFGFFLCLLLSITSYQSQREISCVGCKGESVALLIEQEWSKRWVVSWVIGKIVC